MGTKEVTARIPKMGNMSFYSCRGLRSYLHTANLSPNVQIVVVHGFYESVTVAEGPPRVAQSPSVSVYGSHAAADPGRERHASQHTGPRHRDCQARH